MSEVSPQPMLLAIDTATRTLSIALHDGQQVCAEMTWNTRNQHTVELMPSVQEMLARVNVAPSALTLLAVSEGPGSFNGLRIGFSTAKGLAMALAIPLVTVPTLDVIAYAQPPFEGMLLAVVQAGRGRVCVQSYLWQGGRWQGQGDTRIVGWQALISEISEANSSGNVEGIRSTQPILIAGEVDNEGRTLLESVIIPSVSNEQVSDEQHRQQVRLAPPAYALRRAGFLADLAWERWRVNPTDQAMTAVPLYLHQPGVPHP